MYNCSLLEESFGKLWQLCIANETSSFASFSQLFAIQSKYQFLSRVRNEQQQQHGSHN
jgi:hypothetical protein